MMKILKFKYLFQLIMFTILLGAGGIQPVSASDHADTALLKDIGRNDARLTDFYAYTKQQNMVLVMGIDPGIKSGTSNYTFPTDVTYRFLIDTDSEVSYKDDDANRIYGGTVKEPSKIKEDIVFEITFDEYNVAELNVMGVDDNAESKVNIFTGLRDDPFIVSVRKGKNVAAIVLEFPVDLLNLSDDDKSMSDKEYESTLLLWVTSSVEVLNGNEQEFIGRAFRSTFPENDAMNTLHPRLHYSELAVAPDVMFMDLSQPIGFPNGRLLTDDVVDLVGDPRILAIDIESPIENDVPFMATFPYLAMPQ